MHARLIIRVVCDDGPCAGPQFMDADTGRILFSHEPAAALCVYALNDSATPTAGSRPHVHLVDLVEVEAAS